MLARRIIVSRQTARAIASRTFHTSAVHRQAQENKDPVPETNPAGDYQVAIADKVHPLEADSVENAPFKPSEGFLQPPHVRLHEVTPNPLPSTTTVVPDDNDFDDYVLDMPSVFEMSVGSERAELINPGVWDDLLPLHVTPSSGVGSSIFNPIIIKSQGAKERVVGCLGECYDGDMQDYEEAEVQYWVMEENTFGICDECGLVFYLASPATIAQMELWRDLRHEIESGEDPLKIE